MSEALILNKINVEGNLVIKAPGIMPDRRILGRIRMAWAVLRGKEIGRHFVITDCWIGRNLLLDRKPISVVAEFEKAN